MIDLEPNMRLWTAPSSTPVKWTVGAPTPDPDAPRFLVAVFENGESFIWHGIVFANKEHAHAIKDALNALPEGAIKLLEKAPS